MLHKHKNVAIRPIFWDELQLFVTNDIMRYVLFRKRPYLY